MKNLDLGKFRKARIWTNEHIDVQCTSVRTLSKLFASGLASASSTMFAAVEISVPLGPRSMYGLLGAQFEPNATGQLAVDILISEPNGPIFANSLAGKGDEVRMGLPGEYAQFVIDGLSVIGGESNELPSGRLVVNCAAHGAIGSCGVIYKHLAVVLIGLLNAPQGISDVELIKLFPSSFN